MCADGRERERVLEEVLNGREVVEWRSLVRREEETTARALERAIFPAVEKLGFCDLELKFYSILFFCRRSGLV